MSPVPGSCRNLIIVAGHAPFREDVLSVPAFPHEDDGWVLQPFQCGEPPLYIEHIRQGVALLREDPVSLLIFSGGFTRREAGLRWSEAETYSALAKHFQYWKTGAETTPVSNLSSRIATEDFSRDSFENLLFSICRFQQVTGRYPENVTVVSWAFKEARFNLHRAAIRFPSARFCYHGSGEPRMLAAALEGEQVTTCAFGENQYGATGSIAKKRAFRNPFQRQNDFDRCPGLEHFFAFINDPANGRLDFPGRLPWEN